jgi:hypothetical protein
MAALTRWFGERGKLPREATPAELAAFERDLWRTITTLEINGRISPRGEALLRGHRLSSTLGSAFPVSHA